MSPRRLARERPELRFGGLPDGQNAHVRPAQTARRAILPRQTHSDFQKSDLTTPPNQLHHPRHPASSKRGASRSSRTLGAGCGGRVGAPDERSRYGRQSRVVLAPRRWCQARERLTKHSRVTGARQPGPRGERGISRNTIAQGRPVDPVLTCGSCPVLFLCTGAAGVADTRPSLRPPLISRAMSSQSSGAIARRECLFVFSRDAQRSLPSSPAKAGDPVFQRRQCLSR
jgi:hypothetical protein